MPRNSVDARILDRRPDPQEALRALAARRAMEDLRLAAWFRWMTPFDAALSSRREASRASSSVRSSPAANASSNRRTAVRRADLTERLRLRRSSF